MEMMMAILGNVSPWEIMLIVAVILLLFGASKIPQLMRSMGSGISQFKKGLKDGAKDEEEERKAEEAAKIEGKKEESRAGEPEKK